MKRCRKVSFSYIDIDNHLFIIFFSKTKCMKITKLVSIVMVGWIFLATTVIIGITSCNNAEQSQEQKWPPDPKDDTTTAKRPIPKYTSYGPNVIYINSYREDFAKDLQEWITKNPGRVVTSIAYDPERGTHPTAEGYFIIHYPDSTFNPFKIR